MKYITLFKYLLIYTRNSILSLFSFVFVKFVPKKNIFKLMAELKNKKALVLGTGPSLNNLSQDIINQYDVIVFLNNAIHINSVFNFENKKKIFFNSDLYRIKDKQFIKIFNSLDKSWINIFIIVHLNLFYSLFLYLFKKNIFLLTPNYRLGSPFEKNVTRSLITYIHTKNNDTKKIIDIRNFRAFPHTVALNAFYFLISSKVNQIHYLGCDFTADFSDKKIYLWVIKLKKLAKKYYIDFRDLK